MKILSKDELVSTLAQRDLDIGEVRVIRHGEISRISPIVAHLSSGYGVTCGETGTSNGSIRHVAEYLFNMNKHLPDQRLELEDETYNLEVDIGNERVDLSTASMQVIFEKISAIYKEKVSRYKLAFDAFRQIQQPNN